MPALSVGYGTSLDALFGKNAVNDRAALVPDSVRNGFPYRILAQIVNTLDLDIQRQERLFAVSKSTLHRLAKERKRLNPAISDRIARLIRVYAEVMELFDTSENAKRWLYQPHRILRGSAPIDLLDTDAGTLEVEDMLNGLRYGVYS